MEGDLAADQMSLWQNAQAGSRAALTACSTMGDGYAGSFCSRRLTRGRSRDFNHSGS